MSTERLESATCASVSLDPALPSFNPALLSSIQVALRHGKLVLVVTLILVLLASAIAFLLPALYTASVVILPPQSSSASAAMLAQFGNLGALASMGGGGGD